uniref:WD_REPEATS_REGION domain-containing protein n=1 Tax=Trichuris muris TaxID=70415 RepID=A0A5S6Q8L2_TRIMR
MNMDVDNERSLIFGLDLQARSLAALTSNNEKSVFIAGTQSLKFSNQVCYMEFDDELNQLAKQSMIHGPGEIWHISTCPNRSDLFATCYQSVLSDKLLPGCRIWKLCYGEEEQGTNVDMQSLSELDTNGYRQAACFTWNPHSASCAFALLDGSLVLTDLSSDLAVVGTKTVTASEKGVGRLTAGRWDPHHDCSTIALVSGSSVSGWDVRSLSQTYCIENAHLLRVRDLDFNPNRPYLLATAGDDCQICFWDTRQTKEKLLSLCHHSHWVFMVKYNLVHDQLLLSCSSDSKVVLSCASSLSSEQLEAVEQNGSEEIRSASLPDGMVKVYNDHEESVYCCEWSACDPWLFASLSYDGRI